MRKARELGRTKNPHGGRVLAGRLPRPCFPVDRAQAGSAAPSGHSQVYGSSTATGTVRPRPADRATPAARTRDHRGDDRDLLRRSSRVLRTLRGVQGADRVRRETPRRLSVRRGKARLRQVPGALLWAGDAGEGPRHHALRGPADDVAASLARARTCARQTLRRAAQAEGDGAAPHSSEGPSTGDVDRPGVALSLPRAARRNACEPRSENFAAAPRLVAVDLRQYGRPASSQGWKWWSVT